MLPMAGLTPRSVFPTAMAAAAVPGTPLTEPAAVPRRICRKPTASACITVSRLIRMAKQHMTKPHAHVVVLCTLMLASCLMLAQQNAPNTQGITPPPGSPTPTPARMTFFVTSVGLGKGGDLGGLAGADAHCQALATAVGAGNRSWHAYLSTQARPGQPAVNARDRIGTGPWYNFKGEMIAQDLAHLHGDTIELAHQGNNLNKLTGLTEKGQIVPGLYDYSDPRDNDWNYAKTTRFSTRHRMLTGTQTDGTAFTDAQDHTCNNWTSNQSPAPGGANGDLNAADGRLNAQRS